MIMVLNLLNQADLLLRMPANPRKEVEPFIIDLLSILKSTSSVKKLGELLHQDGDCWSFLLTKIGDVFDSVPEA